MTPPTGAPALSRRTRILLIVGGVVVVALLAGSRLLDYYVNWLWFGEVGYREVFSTILLTRIAQFVLVTVVFAALIAATLVVAFRSRPVFVPVSGPDDPVNRYRTVIMQRVRVFAIGIPVVIGVIAGLAAQGDWQTTQAFLHSTPFGIADPVFGVDVSFYGYQLPFYRWGLNLLFVAVGLCFVVALVTQYVFGGIRLAGRTGQVSVAARAQLAVIAGLFVLLKAVAYWLDRYSLLLAPDEGTDKIFSGASYTDLNAVLPAKIILLFISLICAAAFFGAVFRHNLQLPSIAIALLVLSSVLVGAAWPAVLQQFVVKPNANVRESVPIQRNIDATRQAYGLTNVTYQQYNGQSTPTAKQIGDSAATLDNLRLLDPNKLSKTFTQLEQRKNFYGFPDKLDIDRYQVNGKVQDYVVAARELAPDQLTGNQNDWINRRMVYTHGNGFVAAPANQINSAPDENAGTGGYPNFTVSDTTTKGDIVVNQPRIYYGQLMNSDDYSIVGAPSGTPPREYDSDTQNFTYVGKGGVTIGDPFNRLIFSLYYGEPNILFNGSINGDSKIMYVRNPTERVHQVAPWLTLDRDTYPAVVNGRITWIVDGYTTLANYPYAEQESLADATEDTLPGLARPAADTISYLRNSVKATVDAYDGTVTLYAFDPSDPVLRTWEKVFPNTVRPASEISLDLRAHFRYPQDQFELQRELLAKYHVATPQDFFSTVSFWSVPDDPTPAVTGPDSSTPPQPPYYVLAGLPNQVGPSFQLTSALVSLKRQFLAAYMSVSSDPGSYGRITVLELPTDTQTPGPTQMQTQFVSAQQVSSTINTLKLSQTTIDYGNLLTLPVAGGLLYVEPIYIERANPDSSSYPQLAKVLVGFDGKVGFSSRLDQALQQVGLSGGAVPSVPATPAAPAGVPSPAPSAGNAGGPVAVQQAVSEIRAALDQLRSAQQSGDFAGQGNALAGLDKAIKDFAAASGTAQPSASGASPPSGVPPVTPGSVPMITPGG